MRRSIDGPDKAFISAKEAGEWLGIGPALFMEMAGGETWMRPVWMGSGRRRLKKWPWLDVVCLAHIYSRRQRDSEQAPESDQQ